MIRYNGVYMSTQSLTVAATQSVIELQVPSGTIADIFRIWIGPDEGNDSYVEEVELYFNASAGSGTGVAEHKIRGSDDATAACSVVTGITALSGDTTIGQDAMHTLAGWLYLPQPEERIRIVGGSAQDNYGVNLPNAPTTTYNLNVGIVWGEIG